MAYFSKRRNAGKRNLVFFILGGVVFYLLAISVNVVSDKTSEDTYCMSCHVHAEADNAWKLSTHYDNPAGMAVHCVDCHLPPKGEGFLFAKLKHGAKDIYSFWTKKPEEIDWEGKKEPAVAANFTYNASCVRCHTNLFPATLSDEGGDAHLYYQQNKASINCINCHITVGHFDEKRKHEHNKSFGLTETAEQRVFEHAAKVEKFENFTEFIPHTTVSFEMIAIPEGMFTIGSPKSESFHQPDEAPPQKVQISRFWMGEAEVSWDEFLAFYAQTATRGHASDVVTEDSVDAISGPTAPWGAPDQGWGKGKRPAITMSFHAAEVYCEWLSKVTGKTYRLPTEAEWEYACRAGTGTPYFFAGDPGDYTSKGWKRVLISPTTEVISDYAIYALNSHSKTHEPSEVKPNPFGLLNMPGNVWEFCSDWYATDTYRLYEGTEPVKDPTGPSDGKEHVIRGGAFDSDAVELRSANRDQTHTDEWLVTDPQMPKSIWWYSDSKNVGFRVVCEPDNSWFGNSENKKRIK